MKRWLVGLLVLVLGTSARADSITHGTTTINMDVVIVGSPGNTVDTTGNPRPCGSVGYVYRIGKYEVSENQWDAVVATDTNDLLDDPGSWSGEQPVASISWHEAAMFCNWLTSGDVTQGAYAISGNGEVTGIDRSSAATTYGTVYVIPTENEWYKSAYYDPNKGGPGVPGYWDYPTKADYPNRPKGISRGDPTFDAVYSDPADQGHPNAVDNAGALSAYGTMGQGGNVWEWNETAVGSMRGQRGGSWDYDYLPFASGYRQISSPSFESYRYGFRVASVPEPGSLAMLLGIAFMALGYYRRRKPA